MMESSTPSRRNRLTGKENVHPPWMRHSRFNDKDTVATPSRKHGEASSQSSRTPVASRRNILVALHSEPPVKKNSSPRGITRECVPHFELKEDLSSFGQHNVQVMIRIRPPVPLEGHVGRCLHQESARSLTWTGQPESRFTFDHVAGEGINQEKLFAVAGLPMVQSCLSGFNSCIFAYGQTGSGKSYSMLGDLDSNDERGIIPRVFEHLFQKIRQEEESRQSQGLEFTCTCSFLEIYNEQVFDLLEPSSANLQLREDVNRGVYVENLMQVKVETVEAVMKLLGQGSANRKVAATSINRESSRSHSVFTCVVQSKWESDDAVVNTRVGQLSLIDLAGSERQKRSSTEGDRLRETGSINKSLSTLGLVIMALVDAANGKSRHIPYRDSKLTFLLQDSLGGNSRTIMLATVSPSKSCSSETLSTLKFAQRARFIRNNAIVNEDSFGDNASLRQQLQQVKEELNYLRDNDGSSGSRKQVQELLRRLELAEADRATAESASNHFAQTAATLEADLALAKLELRNARDTHAEEQIKLDKLADAERFQSQALAVAQEMLSSSQLKVDELAFELHKIQSQREEDYMKAVAKLDDLNAKIQRLDDHMMLLDEKNGSQREEIETLSLKVEDLESSRIELQRRNDALQEEMRLLRESLADFAEKKSQALENNAKLEQELSMRLDNLNHAEILLASAREEVSDAARDRNAVSDELRKMTAERDSIRIELDEKSHLVECLHREFSRLSSLVEQKVAELNDVEVLAAEARKVAEASKARAEEKDEQIKVLQRSVRELEDQIAAARSEAQAVTEIQSCEEDTTMQMNQCQQNESFELWDELESCSEQEDDGSSEEQTKPERDEDIKLETEQQGYGCLEDASSSSETLHGESEFSVEGKPKKFTCKLQDPIAVPDYKTCGKEFGDKINLNLHRRRDHFREAVGLRGPPAKKLQDLERRFAKDLAYAEQLYEKARRVKKSELEQRYSKAISNDFSAIARVNKMLREWKTAYRRLMDEI